jgi:hypothetical protein
MLLQHIFLCKPTLWTGNRKVTIIMVHLFVEVCLLRIDWKEEVAKGLFGCLIESIAPFTTVPPPLSLLRCVRCGWHRDRQKGDATVLD